MILMDKRLELVAAVLEGLDTVKIQADIERIEGLIGDDPADIMYSDKWEKIISYKQKVMEIEADKDDFLYSLAGNKGETMESLSRKTYNEIMSFAERLMQEKNVRRND